MMMRGNGLCVERERMEWYSTGAMGMMLLEWGMKECAPVKQGLGNTRLSANFNSFSLNTVFCDVQISIFLFYLIYFAATWI